MKVDKSFYSLGFEEEGTVKFVGIIEDYYLCPTDIFYSNSFYIAMKNSRNTYEEARELLKALKQNFTLNKKVMIYKLHFNDMEITPIEEMETRYF